MSQFFFDDVVTLRSGNLARSFNVRLNSDGTARVAYVYTDRRRNHAMARQFVVVVGTDNSLESIEAWSANEGRYEVFGSSTIRNEIINMVIRARRLQWKQEFESEVEQQADDTVEVCEMPVFDFLMIACMTIMAVLAFITLLQGDWQGAITNTVVAGIAFSLIGRE